MVAVIAISVQVVNGETELCHFTTVPVCPERVRTPLVLPEQIEVPPVTVPPMLAGEIVTARLLAELVPQLLPAVTVIFPFCPADPVVTVIDIVPAPAVIDQPAGTVQV